MNNKKLYTAIIVLFFVSLVLTLVPYVLYLPFKSLSVFLSGLDSSLYTNQGERVLLYSLYFAPTLLAVTTCLIAVAYFTRKNGMLALLVVPVFFLVVPIVGMINFVTVMATANLLFQMPEKHDLVGESMSPTINNNEIYWNFAYNTPLTNLFPATQYRIQRGDLVSFSHPVLSELASKRGLPYSEVIKRVVAIPGDRFEIKNGLVFVNDAPLSERYTLETLSTYPVDDSVIIDGVGYDSFIKNCTPLTVPADSIIVLADNRKNGDDSRQLGFINLSQISGYLPYVMQVNPYYEGTNIIDHSSRWRGVDYQVSEAEVQKSIEYCMN